MSYCVNCGVELGKELKCCPLCGTPVINPREWGNKEAKSFFQNRPAKVQPVSKAEIALLISAMLASVALCCGILNLLMQPEYVRSLYAVGACAMLWVWIVLPLIFRKLPVFVRVGIDLLAVALYLLLIALVFGGMDWYLRLALPVLAAAELCSIVITYIMRGGRRSILSSIIIIIGGIALMSLFTELFIDLFIYGTWTAGWSLIIMTVCLGFSIPLVTVRLVPSLREEVRRRFHL